MLSVLVVDDEVAICEMLGEFLSKKGHKCKNACSGEEALGMIKEKKPDIVFLDLNMPGMGGEAAFKEIKNRYQDLPVVFITVVTDLKKVKELMLEGAYDYITKPIDFAYLEMSLLVRDIFAEPFS